MAYAWELPIAAYLSARRRMIGALVLLVTVVVIGAFGYWYIGFTQSPGIWQWEDCVYMTVITISTVGFGEILDFQTIAGGREWTLVLLVFGVAADLYVLSTITSFFVEADFGNLRRWRKQQRRMKSIVDHYIVCGAGRTGIHVVNELVTIGEEVLVIDHHESVLAELATRGVLTVQGDATDDEVLERAGLKRAKGIVATLDDDRTNMFVVVSARQTMPKLRIVAKALSPSAADKLRRAGADAVVTPAFIGGMRIASELIRPTVVRFLDEMLRDKDANMRIEEATVRESSDICGKTIKDSNLREDTGALVLAVRSPEGGSAYVPPVDLRLQAGHTLIAIGTPDQITALRKRVRHS